MPPTRWLPRNNFLQLVLFVVTTGGLLQLRRNVVSSIAGSSTRSSRSNIARRVHSSSSSSSSCDDYELIIIGAGASGLFAAGAATGLWRARTCLIDHGRTTGGDCTNAACVPSKSWRAKVSIARCAQQEQSSLSSLSSSPTTTTTTNDVRDIREYIQETVNMVRARENLDHRPQPRPNLDLLIVQSCQFVGPRELEVVVAVVDQHPGSAATAPPTMMVQRRRLTAQKFLVCTGADPVVPPALEKAARNAAIPYATYRTLLNPDFDQGDNHDTINHAAEFWEVLESSSRRKRRILVVGGGATACELIQSLMGMDYNSGNLEIVWVAPSILPNEDVIMQQAAYDLLVTATNHSRTTTTTTFHLGRLLDLQSDRRPVIRSARDNRTIVMLDEPVDAMLLCVGRTAATRGLGLEAVAGVQVDGRGRILVRPDLRSISNRRVYAAGDCCSMIPPRHRSASQAAWTGFHAVRNLKVPPFLRWGGNSVAQNIPRIIYTRPELACVGMTNVDCIRQYGNGNYMRQFASEQGTDRADVDRCLPRSTGASPSGFVELRADRQGRIVGCTAFGPAAAEIANSMGIAIESKLTVYDIARAPHGYPSHGYLLYRVALSMALATTFGVIDAFGFRTLSKAAMFVARRIGALCGSASTTKRTLEATGHDSTILYNGRFLTYFDLHRNITYQSARHLIQLTEAEAQRFERWSGLYCACEK